MVTFVMLDCEVFVLVDSRPDWTVCREDDVASDTCESGTSVVSVVKSEVVVQSSACVGDGKYCCDMAGWMLW